MIHFSKKSGSRSTIGSEILTFGSQCLANFQSILDCFIPNFKLEYDDLENLKTYGVNTVVFNLHQIKPVIMNKMLVMEPSIIIYKKELVK